MAVKNPGGAGEVGAGGITEEKLGPESVTAAKIKKETITAEKLAGGSVTNSKIGVEAVSSNEVRIPTKPAVGAEKVITVGTAGVSRIVSANLVGDGAKKEWVIKHELKNLIPSATIIKEKGTAGSETTPSKIVLVKEIKVLTENEIEVIFEVAPAAKEVYWVQIDG